VTQPRFLLDTNTCIYIRRRQPLHVIERFRKLRANEAALSVISFGELHYGAEKGPDPARAREELAALADVIQVLPLPPDAGLAYGSIRAALESKGQMIGGNDAWIAAHALAAGLIVVTNNEREFRRVPDLSVENWVK
jgi:tRNA(fMet)-specific endonuclease VapC